MRRAEPNSRSRIGRFLHLENLTEGGAERELNGATWCRRTIPEYVNRGTGLVWTRGKIKYTHFPGEKITVGKVAWRKPRAGFFRRRAWPCVAVEKGTVVASTSEVRSCCSCHAAPMCWSVGCWLVALVVGWSRRLFVRS